MMIWMKAMPIEQSISIATSTLKMWAKNRFMKIDLHNIRLKVKFSLRINRLTNP